MSGGKKKYFKPAELLYRKLRSDKDFAKAIKKLRKDHGIPIEGYGKDKEEFENKLEGLNYDFIYKCIDVLNTVDLPPQHLNLYLNYIVIGDKGWKMHESAAVEAVCIIDPTHAVRNDMEVVMRENKIPYVKILITKEANNTEIREAIKENKDYIKELFEKQGVDMKGRTKNTQFKERNERTTELMKKGRKGLSTDNDKPLEIAIQRKLKDEGLNVTQEQVRTVPYKKYKR